ncbi:MAG: hypothetical protein ACREQ5_20880, partial [Candidatus Dormibacteria bacterium]
SQGCAREKIMKQKFYLHSTFLGEREIPGVFRDSFSEMRVGNSYHNICPRCGELWAEIILDSAASYHQPISLYCEKHNYEPPNGMLSSTSPWHEDPRKLDWDWPLPALHHEVVQLANEFLRKHHV